MACLRHMSKFWWSDELLKDRLKKEGIRGLVSCKNPGQTMAAKDDWHVLTNRRALVPVIKEMRQQHTLKTPYLEEIEAEVAVLGVLLQNKAPNPETLAECKMAYEVDIHVTSASLKKPLSHLRRKFLLPHVPRDRPGFTQIRVFSPMLSEKTRPAGPADAGDPLALRRQRTFSTLSHVMS